MTATLLVENAGSTTLNSFDYTYSIDGEDISTNTWNGSLEPTERVSLQVTITPSEFGTVMLGFRVDQPNGLQDERDLNGQIRKEVGILDQPHVEVE